MARATAGRPALPLVSRRGLCAATTRRFAIFAAVGLFCTVLFTACYALLRPGLPPLAANALALSATAGVNFALNRAITFRARAGDIRRQAALYAVAYGVGLGASTATLSLLLALARHPAGLFELVLALAASGVATLVRYVAMSRWVFTVGKAGVRATR